MDLEALKAKEAAEVFHAEHDLSQAWLWDENALWDLAAESGDEVQLEVFGELARLAV